MSSLMHTTHMMAHANFMPHGYCYLWLPSLVLLHVISDGVIALSYMLIPFGLAYFVYMRKDLIFSWMFLCFGAFIVSCGATHVMSIWTLWYADYWLSGFIKAFTAIVSFITAILLIKLIPAALRFPSEAMVKDANLAMEKSEKKLSTILEGAPDAMILVEENGVISMVNAQTEKIFGYKRHEILGKHVEVLLPERFRDVHVSHRSKYFENPHTRPMGAGLDLFGKHKSGAEFPVEISLSPVATDEQNFALATIRDITDKKIIEKDILDKNIELVNAAMAKDQFLTHMSHELRTPLHGIISMTQLLMTSKLSDEQKEQIEIISESNEQLLSVINSILDFSKLEAGHIGVDNSDFNIRDLINKAAAGYKLKSRSKNLEFNCQISATIPEMGNGDAIKIRQIITNILDNAVKFTEKGAIDLKVAYHKIDESRADVIFEVTDTGIGISPEAEPKLFQPFSQGDSSMTRKYGGTGLGLAISKQFIEMLGGSINIEASDYGSRVKFNVPYNKPAANLNDVPANNHRDKNHEPEPKQYGRILLVEDNRLNQRSICMLLDNIGLGVTVANDGEEAIRLCSSTNYDLILMDCQMPNMDGYQTTEAIRDNERAVNRHTPIIGVTAHAMEEDREKCLEAGMDDYIAKPFNLHDLRQLIMKYIAK